MTATEKPARRKRPAAKHRPIIRLVPPFTGQFEAMIGGVLVPCRRDGKLRWSLLDYRDQHLGSRTGRRISGVAAGDRVVEVLVPTPWGTMRALLWDLSKIAPGIVFIGGRQSVGGGEPRPESLFDDEEDTEAEHRASRPDWRAVPHLRIVHPVARP